MAGLDVTIALSGGLGNQMFQYAAARGVANRLNVPLWLDTGFYTKGRHRTFDLQSFPLKASICARPSLLQKVQRKLLGNGGGANFREAGFSYDAAVEKLTTPVRMEGYFQSPKYFADCTDLIRAELSPPVPEDAETRALGGAMAQTECISLHVRRGDYVSNPNAAAIFPVCTLAYYRDALQQLPAGLPVHVFSDDIAWAKANLDFGRTLSFAGDRPVATALGDLWLMTKATHHIIANSTFSWWGAWLKSKPGLTIAPTPWFQPGQMIDKDLIPSQWLRVGIAGNGAASEL